MLGLNLWYKPSTFDYQPLPTVHSLPLAGFIKLFYRDFVIKERN